MLDVSEIRGKFPMACTRVAEVLEGVRVVVSSLDYLRRRKFSRIARRMPMDMAAWARRH